MAINPTPSTSTLRVISVGTGKDYATLQAAFNYLNGYDVTAGGQQILVEVYEDQNLAGAALSPNNPSANYYVTVQPVPGAGVNDLDTATALTYGTSGVQITLNTGNYYFHGDGVILQNFRIQVNCGSSGDRAAVLFSRYGQTAPTPSHMEHWRRCRINVTNAINPRIVEIGNTNGEGYLEDNLWIVNAATTATVIDTSSTPTFGVSRNTFVRPAGGAGLAISDTANGVITDNAFVNMGATAIGNLIVASIHIAPTNNWSDYSGDTGKTGFTVATGLLQNTASDFRPATGGPLINMGSASSQNTLDVRGNSRGLVPDIGADELTPQTSVVAPTGAVTSQGPQSGQTYSITFSTANTPTSGVATLDPASTPNGAVLNTGTITFGTNTATATFTGIIPGNYVENITISNATGANAVTGTTSVTITDTRPPVSPTPSTTGFRVVKVGAGLDYTNLSAFATYLNTQNLVTSAEVLCAEVYDDQTITGLTFQPAGADNTHYCLIRPVPGRSVNDLETGAFTYGASGIQLTAATSSYAMVSAGVQFNGFRVRITGASAGDRAAFLMSNYGQTAGVSSVYQGFQSCRFSVESACANAIESGNTGGKVRIMDSLAVFGSTSPSALLSDSNTAQVLRNTFVRLGSAGEAVSQFADGLYTDNVFVNMGGAAMGTSLDAAQIANNYSDNAADTGKTGFTVVAAGSMLADPVSDFRPKAGGSIIGMGDNTAKSVNDILGNNRGLSPDVGARQLTISQPNPKGTVTSQPAPDGQNLTITFSTQNTPTGGQASLDPDPNNPAGAVSIAGTVSLGTNTGTATFTSIQPGNYIPTITLTNAGGAGSVTGLSGVSIIGISGNPTAPPTTSAAPTVTSVTVSPASVSMAGNAQQIFTVAVAGTNSPAQTVTWSCTAGQINSSGLFVAPASTGAAQTVTVTAVSTVDLTKSGSAVVTVAAITGPTLASRTLAMTLADTNGAVANLTGLKIAFYDEPSPDLYSTPRYQTASGTTDASGVLSFAVQSTLASGGTGCVVVQTADGRNLVASVAVV